MSADRLYELPLEEFTSARDQLAKELRTAGDRSRADEVKRLRKPSVAAWVINQLARRSPKGMERLFAVGERLRRAHEELLGGAGVEAVHRVSAEESAVIDALLRDAEEILGDAGVRPAAPLREKIVQTLEATATDDGARERVRTGTLERETRRVGFGGFAVPEAEPGGEAEREARERAERARRLAREAAELEGQAERLARAADEAEEAAVRARTKAEETARRAQAARANADEAEERAR